MSATRRRAPLAQSCAEPHTCAAPLRLQVLGRCPLFAGLPAEALPAIDGRFRATGYAAGDVVYGEGSPATALYVLAAGRVKLTRAAQSGGVVVVDVIAPGQLFGALPALGEQSHVATASAMVVSCVLRADQQAFEDIVRSTPEVAVAALREVGRQLDLARAAVARLSLDSAQARLAETLLDLAARLGHAHGDATLVQLPLTRVDLAAMAGTTPETASRTLSRWKSVGWITSGRRWVAVVDEAALAAVASGAPVAPAV